MEGDRQGLNYNKGERFGQSDSIGSVDSIDDSCFISLFERSVIQMITLRRILWIPYIKRQALVI